MAMRSSCLSRSGGRDSNASICWPTAGHETLMELAVAVTEGNDTVVSSEETDDEDDMTDEDDARLTINKSNSTANFRNSIILYTA